MQIQSIENGTGRFSRVSPVEEASIVPNPLFLNAKSYLFKATLAGGRLGRTRRGFWASESPASNYLSGYAAKETVATDEAGCYTQTMMPSSRKPMARGSRAGLSLLEVLLAMVIVFILFTLYLSAGSKSAQEKKLAACQANLQSIYAAFSTFSQDNNGALPAIPGSTNAEAPLSLLVPKYTTGTEFFICPGGKDEPLPDAQPFADKKISYAYYMGAALADGGEAPLMSDAQVNTLPKTVGQLVFSIDGKKPGNNHNKYGGNVLFGDGNVRYTPAVLTFALRTATNVILLNPKP